MLFVEGATERGDARRKTLPAFFRKWLDPQLPELSRVGIRAVKFQGVSNYLEDLGDKLGQYLESGEATYVFGLVDLYGLPPDRFDFSRCSTLADRVRAARRVIRSLVPDRFQACFRQHFAVHEVEAWLLAYPEKWPPHIRSQIEKRRPEEVNFGEPPAKFLKRLLGGRYRKTVHAKNILPKVDAQIAIDKCPYLRALAHDLLQVAKRLL